MRKVIGKLTAVLGYLLILCYLLKFQWFQLFSLKMMGLLLLGTGILCLPSLEKKRTVEEWQNIIGKNAMMAGYLEAFMLIFASMGSNELMQEGLLMKIGLNLRPVLYGYILYIILEKESGDKKDKKSRVEDREDLPQQEGESRDDTKTQSGASIIQDAKNADHETEEKEEKKPLWESDKLTRREREVACLISKNLSNREIGEELFISEATVKKHVSNIFEKLGIDSRAELKGNEKNL